MSFITTFILTVFIDYFSNKIRSDNPTIFLYTIPIILGIAGAVLLVSYIFLVEGIGIVRINGDIFQLIPHRFLSADATVSNISRHRTRTY